jgi:hypothetical protein
VSPIKSGGLSGFEALTLKAQNREKKERRIERKREKKREKRVMRDAKIRILYRAAWRVRQETGEALSAGQDAHLILRGKGSPDLPRFCLPGSFSPLSDPSMIGP